MIAATVLRHLRDGRLPEGWEREMEQASTLNARTVSHQRRVITGPWERQ